MIADGLTLLEISDALGIVRQMADFHSSEIRRRTCARTTCEAIAILIASGVVPITPSIPTVELSIRQTQVLRGYAGGLSQAEVAAHLGLIESTVDFHGARVRAKLGAKTTAHAIAIAMSSDTRSRNGEVVLDKARWRREVIPMTPAQARACARSQARIDSKIARAK